jgi:fermentation-respiration switch protein FrsA (DUF1100 family)
MAKAEADQARVVFLLTPKPLTHGLSRQVSKRAAWFYTESHLEVLLLPSLLVVHGQYDEIVPFSQGREVFDVAPSPKDFYAVEGGGYNDLLDKAGDDYVIRLREFYRTLLPERN